MAFLFLLFLSFTPFSPFRISLKTVQIASCLLVSYSFFPSRGLFSTLSGPCFDSLLSHCFIPVSAVPVCLVRFSPECTIHRHSFAPLWLFRFDSELAQLGIFILLPGFFLSHLSLVVYSYSVFPSFCLLFVVWLLCCAQLEEVNTLFFFLCTSSLPTKSW